MRTSREERDEKKKEFRNTQSSQKIEMEKRFRMHRARSELGMLGER